jgi:hypothetical protein
MVGHLMIEELNHVARDFLSGFRVRRRPNGCRGRSCPIRLSSELSPHRLCSSHDDPYRCGAAREPLPLYPAYHDPFGSGAPRRSKLSALLVSELSNKLSVRVRFELFAAPLFASLIAFKSAKLRIDTSRSHPARESLSRRTAYDLRASTPSSLAADRRLTVKRRVAIS